MVIAYLSVSGDVCILLCRISACKHAPAQCDVVLCHRLQPLFLFQGQQCFDAPSSSLSHHLLVDDKENDAERRPSKIMAMGYNIGRPCPIALLQIHKFPDGGCE